MNKDQIKQSIRKNYTGAVIKYVPEIFGSRYEAITQSDRLGVLSSEEKYRMMNKLNADIIEWCDSDESSQDVTRIISEIYMGNTDKVIGEFPENLQQRWSAIKKIQKNLENELIEYLNSKNEH